MALARNFFLLWLWSKFPLKHGCSEPCRRTAPALQYQQSQTVLPMQPFHVGEVDLAAVEGGEDAGVGGGEVEGAA